MNWSDERYVRLYTRDTVTWKRWGWETRAVMGLLLRKVDRSGVLDTGAHDKVEAFALLLEIPVDVAERAIAELVRCGTLVESEGGFLLPTFIEAQEAPQSDAARQRDSRERRRAANLRNNDDACHAVSRGVTDGHAASHENKGGNADRLAEGAIAPSGHGGGSSQLKLGGVPNAEPATSRNHEDACHAPSHAVTPCHNLSLQPSVPSVPSVPKEGAIAPAAEPPPPKPKKPKRPDPSDADERHQPLVRALDAVFREARGAGYPWKPRDFVAVRALLATNATPEALVAAWKRALAHRGFPTVSSPSELHDHLAHFVGAGPPAPAVTDKSTRAPQPTHDWADVTPGEVTFG